MGASGRQKDPVSCQLLTCPSTKTSGQVRGIRELMQATKQRLRNEQPKLYSQDLLNNLFRHPYT